MGRDMADITARRIGHFMLFAHLTAMAGACPPRHSSPQYTAREQNMCRSGGKPPSGEQAYAAAPQCAHTNALDKRADIFLPSRRSGRRRYRPPRCRCMRTKYFCALWHKRTPSLACALNTSTAAREEEPPRRTHPRTVVSGRHIHTQHLHPAAGRAYLSHTRLPHAAPCCYTLRYHFPSTPL